LRVAADGREILSAIMLGWLGDNMTDAARATK